MIVCICNRVSDRDIKAAVRDGVSCFDLLQDDLGVAACCGCCHDCAREVFDAACAERGQQQPSRMPVPIRVVTA